MYAVIKVTPCFSLRPKTRNAIIQTSTGPIQCKFSRDAIVSRPGEGKTESVVFGKVTSRGKHFVVVEIEAFDGHVRCSVPVSSVLGYTSTPK